MLSLNSESQFGIILVTGSLTAIIHKDISIFMPCNVNLKANGLVLLLLGKCMHCSFGLADGQFGKYRAHLKSLHLI